MRYIVNDHRNRKRLTLGPAELSDGLASTITVTLPGTRIAEFSDKLTDRYADAFAEHVKRGVLTPLPDASAEG